MRKLFALVLVLIVFALAGCASWGEHQDPDRIIQAARTAGGAIGGAAAGPAGVGIGEAVAGTIATALVGLAGLAGVRWGERRGWDEADTYNGRALDSFSNHRLRHVGRVVPVAAVEDQTVRTA